jgi:hydrogenase maturation factor
MTVVRIDEQRGLALCADAGGTRHTVESALVEPLAAGRVVLVHAGVAIASLPCDNRPPAGATTVLRSAEAGAISANVGRWGLGTA